MVLGNFATSPPYRRPDSLLHALRRRADRGARREADDREGRLVRKGREFIRSSQGPDGAWTGHHGAEMNTCWAILFLAKSTAKTCRSITIKRLGAGTLLGGRELPKDLTSMTVAGGRVVSRPMNGAIEGCSRCSRNPAPSGRCARSPDWSTGITSEGPEALRPFKVRFRKMLSDKDVGVQRGAAWGAGAHRRPRRHSAID